MECDVTPKTLQGWLKSDFLFFLNKIKFQSNKVCYKVSLCENFQRQSCSITIPRFNGPWILAQNVTFNLKFCLKLTHTLKIAELTWSFCYSWATCCLSSLPN